MPYICSYLLWYTISTISVMISNHTCSSTLHIWYLWLMPTLSVVPLVLTVPNFLATQVDSKSHMIFSSLANSGGFTISPFISLSLFLSFFHLRQLRWLQNLTSPFFLFSSLATQVAPRSHTFNGTNITLHVLQVVRPKNITFSFLLGCVQAFYLCINT